MKQYMVESVGSLVLEKVEWNQSSWPKLDPRDWRKSEGNQGSFESSFWQAKVLREVENKGYKLQW